MNPEYGQQPSRHYDLAPPRRRHTVFNAFVAVTATVIGYAALTTHVAGPAFGEVTTVATQLVASIQRSGDDLIVTGSLGHLFSGGAFSGPNRMAKQDRIRIVPDALSFSGGFEEARVRIASLRGDAIDPVLEQSAPDAVEAATRPADEPQISVAAIDPAMLTSSPALGAIDNLAGDPNAPMPTAASEQLAYARANAPVTDFTVVRDANGKVVSEKELWCLATAIYFEARSESYRGQVAVAQVVMNRTKHKLYPGTICGVVYQNQNKRNSCQFSFACDGRPERVTEAKAWEEAEEIAQGVVRGNLYLTEVGYATHYHATYVYPHWAPRMKKVTKIGLHVFYQFKRGWNYG